jgi:hypothetical protein
MNDDTTTKVAWEAPSTVALTDTDSRADQPDVALRNGTPLPSPTG